MYASVSELKDRLGITDTDRDFALDRSLEAASRWIDMKLGTRFYTTPDVPEIRYYTVDDCSWDVRVDDLLSLTELATDANGDGVYETVWTLGTDYRLGPVNATYKGWPYRKLEKVWWTGRFSFPTYDRAIRITSEAFGYCTAATMPPGIRELALMVAEQYAHNVLDSTMPGAQTYKLGTELTITSATRDLPKLALDILQEFRPTGGFIA